MPIFKTSKIWYFQEHDRFVERRIRISSLLFPADKRRTDVKLGVTIDRLFCQVMAERVAIKNDRATVRKIWREGFVGFGIIFLGPRSAIQLGISRNGTE